MLRAWSFLNVVYSLPPEHYGEVVGVILCVNIFC